MKRKQRLDRPQPAPIPERAESLPALSETGRAARQQLLSAWHKAWKERKSNPLEDKPII